MCVIFLSFKKLHILILIRITWYKQHKCILCKEKENFFNSFSPKM